MIKTFADKRTAQLFEGRAVRKLDAHLQKQALRRLRYIDAAECIEDLRIPPSNRLEKKHGDLQDYWSVRVNDQWRIIFKWVDGEACEVALTDYH